MTYTRREDEHFINNMVRKDGLSSKQQERVLQLATDLYRYGGLQVSIATRLATRLTCREGGCK